MRLWHTLPNVLSSQLLLRQHQTCHLLLTAIAGGKPTGGMARYQNHAGFVVWMHWLCLQEMAMRAKNHNSPVAALWYRTPPTRRELNIYIPSTRIATDIADLRIKYAEVSAAGRYWDSTLSLKMAGNQLVGALAYASARGVQNQWLTS